MCSAAFDILQLLDLKKNYKVALTQPIGHKGENIQNVNLAEAMIAIYMYIRNSIQKWYLTVT